MPHIVVEYSDNLNDLDLQGLMHDLHETLAKKETITKSAIKTRAFSVPFCVVGEDDQPDEMMHITLRLLHGRDVEIRRKMAEALFSVAQSYLKDRHDNCALSLEIVEMEIETYMK